MSRDRADAQTAWADAIIAGLFAAGVHEVITSPGSRSTPLVLAAARASILGAAIIDERAAAFYALGRARVTGEPSAVLCTSGSAGAHYLPAVIEASEANLPLVAITADRPPELHGAAAPQTIDQTRLYGAFVRASIDLGPPRASEWALDAASRRAAQAAWASLDPEPGPIHINAPFDEPLAPEDIGPIPGPTARPGGAALRAAIRAPGDAAIAELADRCRRARRGLLVAGPAAPSSNLQEAAHALAEASGFPVLVEAASQLRFLGSATPALARDAFDLSLSSAEVRRRVRPDLVLQLGRPPTSATLRAFLGESPATERVILSAEGFPDPDRRANLLVRGDVAIAASQLTAALRDDPGKTDPDVASILARADRVAWRLVDEELERSAEALSEGAAARAALEATPSGGLLCLGNSLPIRTVDRFCPARLARVSVASQRGANGIDGLIAGAAGAAAASGAPTLALVGDVSFAHDVGGLAAAATARAPLAIVVLDNGGGRIFDALPIAERAAGAAWYRDHFRTPPALASEAAAAAFGIPAHVCRRADELRDATREALAAPGCTVIRALVDPESAARSVARLRDAMGAVAASDLEARA